MSEQGDNLRNKFLLHLYDQLWNSITRVEQGLWQFIGIYAVIFVTHLTLGEKDPFLATVLATLAGFWGINIAINAGKWFGRNRMMIINVEKQFLAEKDFGKIISKRFHERKSPIYFNTLILTHIVVFSIYTLVSPFIYWGNIETAYRNIIVVFFVLGVVATLWHWRIAWKEIQKFIKETEGVDSL